MSIRAPDRANAPVPHDTGEGTVVVTLHARRRWLERIDETAESPRLAIAGAWRDGNRERYTDDSLARVYGPQNAILVATGAESAATILTVVPAAWMDEQAENQFVDAEITQQ